MRDPERSEVKEGSQREPHCVVCSQIHIQTVKFRDEKIEDSKGHSRTYPYPLDLLKMSLFAPLQYILTSLKARWPEDKKVVYTATYESDVLGGAKIVVKAIGFELKGIHSDAGAKQIVKCLWTELKHIESANTPETVLTILKEFSERFLKGPEGRTEVLKIMSGAYEVDEDSENSDCDSLCSSCESSEKRERDGWHRMRMLIREMAGPDARRSGIALRKKIPLA